MTRDYQYAAAQFNDFAAASEQAGDDARWTPAVSYVDYAGGVEDVMALCLTGFPSFDQEAAQRRSLIYVGPGSRRAPGETRPTLFTADAVRGSGGGRRCSGQCAADGTGRRRAGGVGPRDRRPFVPGELQ